MDQIGICALKGMAWGFLVVLVKKNKVSNSAILNSNRVWFLPSGLELGMRFRRSYLTWGHQIKAHKQCF